MKLLLLSNIYIFFSLLIMICSSPSSGLQLGSVRWTVTHPTTESYYPIYFIFIQIIKSIFTGRRDSVGNMTHYQDQVMTTTTPTPTPITTTTTTTATTTTTSTPTTTTLTATTTSSPPRHQRKRIIWCGGTASTNRPFSKINIYKKSDFPLFFPLQDTILFYKNALRFRNATQEDIDWLLTQAEEERLEYLDSIDHYDIFIVVEDEEHILTTTPTPMTPEQYVTESMQRFDNWYRITHPQRYRSRQLYFLSHGLLN